MCVHHDLMVSASHDTSITVATGFDCFFWFRFALWHDDAEQRHVGRKPTLSGLLCTM